MWIDIDEWFDCVHCLKKKKKKSLIAKGKIECGRVDVIQSR